MSQPKQLTRVCSSCGQQKPISAFLQISSTQGTVYGTICAPCRSTSNKAKLETPSIEDEKTTTTAGLRIGAKEKFEIDKQQKIVQQQLEESHTEKLKKRGDLATQKEEKTQKIEQLQKDHRDNFLIDKKTDYLNYNKNKKSGINIQGILQQTEQSNKAFTTKQILDGRAAGGGVTSINAFINSVVPHVSPHTALLMMQSPEYQTVLNQLGRGHIPIMQTIRSLIIKNNTLAERQGKIAKSEPGADYIKENWNPTPGTPRKR